MTHLSKPKDGSKGQPLCHYYGGIPYGLPPVGPFRWRKPRKLPPCYRYGHRANPGRFTGGASVCPQNGASGPAAEDLVELFDEDCLQLNIWVPAGEPPKGGKSSPLYTSNTANLTLFPRLARLLQHPYVPPFLPPVHPSN